MVLTSLSASVLFVTGNTIVWIIQLEVFALEMFSLGRETFLTSFDRSRIVGALLQRGFLDCCSPIIRISQVGRIGSPSSCSRQVRLIFDVKSGPLFSDTLTVRLMSRTIYGKV